MSCFSQSASGSPIFTSCGSLLVRGAPPLQSVVPSIRVGSLGMIRGSAQQARLVLSLNVIERMSVADQSVPRVLAAIC
jgi:hypothetical protein